MKIRVATRYSRLGVATLLLIALIYYAYEAITSELPRGVVICFLLLLTPIVLALLCHAVEILEDTKHANKED